MAITFACDRCGKRYEVADGLAGKRARCKQCGNEFTVPALPMSAHRLSPPIPAVDPYALEEEEPSFPSRVAEPNDELASGRTAPTAKKNRRVFQVAHDTAYQALPAHRHRFSPKKFTMSMFFPLIYRIVRPNTLKPVKLAPLLDAGRDPNLFFLRARCRVLVQH